MLIVDKVEDTRTLEYAVKELEKDIEAVSKRLERFGEKTRFLSFILHVSAPGSFIGQEKSWT